MLKKIFKHTRIFALVFCLALTAIVQVQKANAVVGITAGFIPGIIIAATAEIGLIGLSSILWDTFVPTATGEISAILNGVLLHSFLLLDEKHSSATFQSISLQKSKEYNLNLEQLLAYNEAVQNGEMEAFLQSAVQEFSALKYKNLNDARAIIKNLTSALDKNVSDAFYRISASIAPKLIPTY